MIIGNLYIKRCVFLPGKGIHDAADGIYRSGNIESGSAFCTFEQHVLNEMGHAVSRLIFITGTTADPCSDGYGTNVADLFRDKPDTVIENGFIDHLSQCFLPAQSDFSLFINFQDFDLDLVTFLDNVGNLVDPLFGELRDMNESFRSR